IPDFTAHDVKQPISFLRRIFASGVCDFASLTPHRGVGGAPRDVRVLGGTPVGRAHDAARQALARRLASHNAGRSPLGAPPWRFFTRGRASFSGIASGSVQRAPRSQVVVPGGRLPGPPGANGYKPPPQDATPRSAFRIVSRRRPSMSEAASLLARPLYVVKRYLQTVATGGCRWRPRDPDVGASSTSTMAPLEIAGVMSRSKPEIMVQSAKAAPCTMIGSTAFKTSAAGRLAQMGHAGHHRGVWLKGGRPWRSCAA